MPVVIFLILITLILLGGYLRGWIDKDTLQALGWIITIVAGIGAILQFVFPLATSLESNFSSEPPEGISVNGGATALPTSTNTLSPTTPPPPEPTITPDPSQPIISDKDGMTLLNVPEGDFPMGSAEDDPDAYDNEKPLHTVFLSAYRIDQTEVTNAMFAKFLNEMGNQEEGGTTWLAEDSSWSLIENVSGTYQPKEGFANHPVVVVSWYGATAYCQWAGRRLPTEAEWEKAAGGTDSRKWPWGNETPTGELANICDANCEYDSWKDSSIDDGYAQTSPVGNYPAGASPYGALDMAGNVWEWCSDTYDSSYYASSPKDNPQGPTSQGAKVLCGGS